MFCPPAAPSTNQLNFASWTPLKPGTFSMEKPYPNENNNSYDTKTLNKTASANDSFSSKSFFFFLQI
jgi:hypothetical protein